MEIVTAAIPRNIQIINLIMFFYNHSMSNYCRQALYQIRLLVSLLIMSSQIRPS